MEQRFRNKFGKLALRREQKTNILTTETEPQQISNIIEPTEIQKTAQNVHETEDPNITDDLDLPFIDTPQESEPSSVVNKVLLSSSNEIAKTNKSSRHTELFTSNLYLSDSDSGETNCSVLTQDDNEPSSKPSNNETEPTIDDTESQLERLQIDDNAESEDLFPSSSDFSLPPVTQKRNPNVNRLSQQMVNLSLIDEVNAPLVSKYYTGTTVDNELGEDIRVLITETVPPPLPVLAQCKANSADHFSGTTVANTSVDEPLSVVTISSDSSGEVTNDDDQDESEDEEDSEDEETPEIVAISILDSEEENDQAKEEDIVPPTNRTSLSSLSSTVANKLDAFFNNIPPMESPNASFTSEKNCTAEHSVYVSETSVSDVQSGDSVYVSETPESAETSIEADRNDNVSVPIVTAKSSGALPATVKSMPKSLSKCVTPTINISAKINIKIHVPDDASSESGESMSSKSSDKLLLAADNCVTSPLHTPDEATNTSFFKTSSPKLSASARVTRSSAQKTLLNSANETANTSTRSSTDDRLPLPKTVPELVAPPPANDIFLTPMVGKKRSQPISRRSEIEPSAQSLLTELYGKAWQTPELVRKCTAKVNGQPKPVQRPQTERPPKLPRDSFAMAFSKYRRNIANDLESTRIGLESTRIESMPKLIDNEPIASIPVANDSNATEDLPMLRSNKKRLAYKIIDDESDSSTDDFTDALSDDSWSNKGSECDSTSSDEDANEIGPGRRPKKGTTNKSFADKLIYFDLTSVEADIDPEHDCPNATAEALEEITRSLLITNILDSCEFKKKVYQTNPAKDDEKKPKTRRKLFNPSQYNFPDETDIKNIRNYSPEVRETTPPVNVNPKLLIPINRRLGVLKQIEIEHKINHKPEVMLSPSVQPSTKVSSPVVNPFETPITIKGTPTAGGRSQKKVQNLLKDPYQSAYKTFGFLHSLDHRIMNENCHPEAIPYRNNFKANRDKLTERLFDLYNLNVFDCKLVAPVTWNKKLTSTSGRCLTRKRQGILSCNIELSEKVVTSADRLRCTLIHEMCHAATWMFNEENGHGATWKKWAEKANYVFVELPLIKVCHNYEIEYKYVYTCTLCGAKSKAHSKSKKLELIRCAYCHGAIEVFLNKKDKNGEFVLVPIRKPSGFAAFVKDNYKKYKRTGVTHADVMKLLSNSFAKLKLPEANE